MRDVVEREVRDNSTFRTLVQDCERSSVCLTLAEGVYAWDFRVKSPWDTFYVDDDLEYQLRPAPNSHLVLRAKGEEEVVQLDGQWDIPPYNSGAFRGVQLTHATLVLDAREVILINGGPWAFDECQLRASGCQVLRCEMQADVRVGGSFVGGFGNDELQSLASNGVVCIDGARVHITDTLLECTGFLGGAALKFRQDCVAGMRGCTVRHNVLAFELDDNADVTLQDCEMYNNSYSIFTVEGDNITLALRGCRGAGPVWSFDERPERLEETDCMFQSSVEEDFEKAFTREYLNRPIWENLPKWRSQTIMDIAEEKGDLDCLSIGPNIHYCLACGADMDVEDSETCYECGHTESHRKYGLPRKWAAGLLDKGKKPDADAGAGAGGGSESTTDEPAINSDSSYCPEIFGRDEERERARERRRAEANKKDFVDERVRWRERVRRKQQEGVALEREERRKAQKAEIERLRVVKEDLKAAFRADRTEERRAALVEAQAAFAAAESEYRRILTFNALAENEEIQAGFGYGV